jgi:hypothetical protein
MVPGLEHPIDPHRMGYDPAIHPANDVNARAEELERVREVVGIGFGAQVADFLERRFGNEFRCDELDGQ